MGPCLSSEPRIHANSGWDELDKETERNDRAAAAMNSSKYEEASIRFGAASIKMDRKLAPPSKKGILHPTIDFESDEWCLYLDDDRNPYFYNNVTGQSQWTIPPELLGQRVFEHPDCITVIVKVPDKVAPGKAFTVDVYCQPVELVCPEDCCPGDEIELRFPLHSDDTAAAAAAGDAEDAVVDALAAWSALAVAADESLALIEKDVAIAKDVLSQVSGGCYLDDLIFQLSWSHRVAQLELAVQECYRKNGNFRDSRAYDNCKGVPRYSRAGLVEWWQDLKQQRVAIDEALASTKHNRVFGDTDGIFRSSNDLDRRALEESILNGDTSSILKGLVQRKQVIEQDLDKDMAQMIAIVSIQGPPKPPSKESLDAVHDYLAESIAQSSMDLIDMMEDVEEFVSNTLEPRHRFVVDVVTNVALLEFELDGILKQIAEFSAPPPTEQQQDQQDQQQEQQRDDAGREGDTDKSGGGDSNDQAQHNAALQDLLSSQHVAANDLAAALDAKQRAQKKALLDRIEQQKIKKLLKLKKDGMGADEAAAAVQQEADADMAAGLRQIQDDASAALRAFNKKVLEDMRALGETEEARLAAELQAAKDKQLRAMQDRLNKKREARKLEVAQAGAHMTAAELETAIDTACALVDHDGAAEEARIIEQSFNALRNARSVILGDIKSQHEIEATRLERDLQAQQDAARRALKNRLHQKLNQQASEIFAREAAAGNAISAAESLALAQADCDHEEAEALQQIEQTYSQSVGDSQQQLMASLKEMHAKEVAKLEGEMRAQEDSQRGGLQKRLDARRKEKEAEAAAVHNDDQKKERLLQELAADEAKAREESEAFIAKLRKAHAEESAELGLALLDKHQYGTLNLKKRLAKRKAQAEKEALRPAAGVKLEAVVAEAKATQQEQAQRLRDLIQASKAAAIGVSAVRDRGKVLLQYAVMAESVLEGHKKRSLYHLKAIKAAVAARGAKEDSIEPDEVKRLLSPEINAEAAEVALKQILARSVRDLNGLVNVQEVERSSAKQKMRENGASKAKCDEMQRRLDDESRAALGLEVQKDMLCISALRLRVVDLMETGPGEGAPRGLRKADSVADLMEEGPELQVVAPFGSNINSWAGGVLPLSAFYADSLCALLEYLDYSDRRVLGEASAGTLAGQGGAAKSDVAAASRALRSCLLKPLLEVLMQAFCADAKAFDASRFAAYSQGNSVPVDKSIVQSYSQLKEAVQRAYVDASSGPEAAACSEALRASIAAEYAQSVKDWLSHPVLSAAELSAKEFATRGLLPAEPRSGASEIKMGQDQGAAVAAMQLEAREREQELIASLGVKVEKKKKDLQARLAMRREQRERDGGAAAASSSAEAQREDRETEGEIQKLDSACAEVTALLRLPSAKLEDINADGLMAAVDRRAAGLAVSASDLAALQKEVESSNSNTATQRLMQQQLESADKLDIAQKIKKGRDQKNLQDRLLKRQRQKERESASIGAP